MRVFSTGSLVLEEDVSQAAPTLRDVFLPGSS